VFVGLLYNDAASNGRRWITQMGGQSYPSVLDRGSRAAIDYGVYGVPETFFIGKDGRVAHKHLGPVTDAVLDGTIERLRNAPIQSSGGGGP
jgi:cytochrome c biogenesis protein CcmG/thiol:disulfide interchange protein DsbE